MSTLSEAGTRNGTFVFQLFVAGDESNSREARENFKAICESHLKGHYKIQIVDVFESFDMALENGIFLTPALVRVSPSPKITVFGNLSDTKSVLKALQIRVSHEI